MEHRKGCQLYKLKSNQLRETYHELTSIEVILCLHVQHSISFDT